MAKSYLQRRAERRGLGIVDADCTRWIEPLLCLPKVSPEPSKPEIKKYLCSLHQRSWWRAQFIAYYEGKSHGLELSQPQKFLPNVDFPDEAVQLQVEWLMLGGQHSHSFLQLLRSTWEIVKSSSKELESYTPERYFVEHRTRTELNQWEMEQDGIRSPSLSQRQKILRNLIAYLESRKYIPDNTSESSILILKPILQNRTQLSASALKALREYTESTKNMLRSRRDYRRKLNNHSQLCADYITRERDRICRASNGASVYMGYGK